MTKDINDIYGVTIEPAKSVGKNAFTAKAVVFRRADSEDVHELVGKGGTGPAALADAERQARGWAGD